MISKCRYCKKELSNELELENHLIFVHAEELVKKNKNKNKGLFLFIAGVIGAISLYLLIKNKKQRQQTDNQVNQSFSFNNKYSNYLRGY